MGVDVASPLSNQKLDFARCLRRYNVPKKYARKPIIAVDIETDGLGGAFLIGGYARETDEIVHHFTTIDAWLDAIFSNENYGYIWYAHNGGEYDFKYLFDSLKTRFADNENAVINVRFQGTRCIGIKIRYNNRNYELRDSYALMPSSLKRLSMTLAPDYAKRDIGLSEGVTFNPNNAEHMLYLEYDILGLLHTILEFQRIVWDVFGVPCGWTAPATALMAWRHTLTRDDMFWRCHTKAEMFFRKAYYGGLVFICNSNYVDDVTSIDFNSMYPSVMRDYGVPIGLPVYTDQYIEGCPGIYHVKASIPDDFPFTMIPYRVREGTLWPKGDFETYVTSCEMEFAQQHGATFNIIDGYFFESEAKIFTDFINTCEWYRINYKGSGIEDVVKIMQNGLYGKFGSKDVIASYALRTDDKDGEFTPAIDNEGEVISHLYFKLEKVNGAYIQPHWAAWITSRARLRLSEAVYAIGPENVVYGDTDSIYARSQPVHDAIERGALRTNLSYGSVKVEHHFSRFRAGGPKNYLGILDSGDILHKAKGMPRAMITDDDHIRALAGEKVTVEYQSMNGTLAMLKTGVGMTTTRKRSYSQLENSAGWLQRDDGLVVPITIERTG